jgi:carboxylesterase 2/para-nitrobenzyl esterase
MLTNLPWEPAIDGTLITDVPYNLVKAGASAGVELLVGTNVDETRLFLVPGGIIDQIPPPALAGMIAGYGLPVDKTLAAYSALYPAATPGDLMSAIQTDWYWRIPALRLADAHAAVPGAAGTYMYEFAWASPAFDGRLGAAHSVEIGFVFDTLGKGTQGVAGPNPPQALADVMHKAWVGFMTDGAPGWPRYEATRHATMHFDLESKVVDDPLGPRRALWDGVR